MLEAKKTGFRGVKHKYVRITPEGCINSNDMMFLLKEKPEEKKMLILGKKEKRNFCKVSYNGKVLLADIITGSLYDPVTGLGSSPLLSIVV